MSREFICAKCDWAGVSVEWGAVKEELRCHCHRCGYLWDELPSDANKVTSMKQFEETYFPKDAERKKACMACLKVDEGYVHTCQRNP